MLELKITSTEIERTLRVAKQKSRDNNIRNTSDYEAIVATIEWLTGNSLEEPCSTIQDQYNR
jgi:hypothetical protein